MRIHYYGNTTTPDLTCSSSPDDCSYPLFSFAMMRLEDLHGEPGIFVRMK